nr:glycosyltransferase family 2 protein [uncultured Acetatifactor sp.]
MKDQTEKTGISVIIPVYNAEKYIERCINSVVAQTYNNWEMIVINDGSTDNTENIIREKAKADNRIQIYSQNNQGAGIARNNGISKATGEYIVFLDADDYVNKEYFSLLMEKNEDVVFIDAKKLDEKTRAITLEKMSRYKAKEKDDIIRYQMIGTMPWGGWRKAVKHNILIEKEIYFSNHKVGEEAIYSFCLMHFAKSFSFLNKDVYNYEVHENSLSQAIQEDPWGEVAIELKEKVLQMGLYDQYANTINAFIVTSAVISLDRMTGIYRWSEYKVKAKERVLKCKREMDSNYPIDIKHMDSKAKMIYPFIKVDLIIPIYIISRMYKKLKYIYIKTK